MATRSERQLVRPINYVALGEVILLSGIATLLTIKWLRGQLDYYIHPRYTALILVSAVILLLMAGVRLRGIFAPRTSLVSVWFYAFLALPLLVGIFVPAQPLGADTLTGRGLDPSSTLNVTNWQPATSTDSSSWNLLEWAVAFSTGEDQFVGKPADVIGFVFQDDKLGANHFYVARYVVTCCAADGVSVGMPVAWEGGATLQPNSWVRVQGTVDRGPLAGSEQPVIMATSVEPVAQPRNPYLYP